MIDLDEGELVYQALTLPTAARAALAGLLIRSLDEEPEVDAEEEWRIEVERRLAEIDAGAVAHVPWQEARRQIRDD